LSVYRCGYLSIPFYSFKVASLSATETHCIRFVDFDQTCIQDSGVVTNDSQPEGPVSFAMQIFCASLSMHFGILCLSPSYSYVIRNQCNEHFMKAKIKKKVVPILRERPVRGRM